MKLGYIYSMVREMEQAVMSMGTDFEHAIHQETKEIISEELESLSESYKNLFNSDIVLDVDLDSLIKQVEVCVGYMNFS